MYERSIIRLIFIDHTTIFLKNLWTKKKYGQISLIRVPGRIQGLTFYLILWPRKKALIFMWHWCIPRWYKWPTAENWGNDEIFWIRQRPDGNDFRCNITFPVASRSVSLCRLLNDIRWRARLGPVNSLR